MAKQHASTLPGRFLPLGTIHNCLLLIKGIDKRQIRSCFALPGAFPLVRHASSAGGKIRQELKACQRRKSREGCTFNKMWHGQARFG